MRAITREHPVYRVRIYRDYTDANAFLRGLTRYSGLIFADFRLHPFAFIRIIPRTFVQHCYLKMRMTIILKAHYISYFTRLRQH